MKSPKSKKEDPPRAVVFDLDGVLVGSEALWDRARRAVVADAGGAWRDGATRDMLGMSSTEWSRYVHERLGVAAPPEEIVRRVLARLLDEYRRSLPLLPGAVTAVETLGSHWPLGLATSSNREVIDEVLALAGLGGRFAVTVTSEDVARGKPAPDVYLAATGALGVDPGTAVAIEDSTNGLKAAAAAGMRVIAVPNREFPPDPGALALAGAVVPTLESLTPDVVASVRPPG